MLLGLVLFLAGCVDNRIEEIEKEYEANMNALKEKNERAIELTNSEKTYTPTRLDAFGRPAY